MQRLALTASAATALLALSACGGTSDTQSEDTKTTTLHVAAAASLTESFEELAKDYEQETPDVTVDLQFAGSSDLASQITNGADLDVFASADEATMEQVQELAGTPTPFATNTLTIITEPGNPEQVTGLDDLSRKGLKVVVCAPQVPCGAAAKTLTREQDVTLTPASEESKVTDVLAKVSSGEADAGLVYVTDAQSAGEEVEAIRTEGADEVVNNYPIATLTDSRSPDEAKDFIDYVTGPKGQKVLQDYGFGAP